MKNFMDSFHRSALELKKTRTLTTMSLLVALGVLLGMVKIIPTDFLKFGVGFLVTASMGFLFGPVPAMLGAAGIDLITFVLRPTGPYFFGFTFNAMLAGLFYGALLYQKPVRIWRVLFAKGLESLVVNVTLNTLWLAVLYGKSISALLPVRLAKNAVSLPVETALLCAALLGIGKAWRVSRAART